jgi:hypothetical protein
MLATLRGTGCPAQIVKRIEIQPGLGMNPRLPDVPGNEFIRTHGHRLFRLPVRGGLVTGLAVPGK